MLNSFDHFTWLDQVAVLLQINAQVTNNFKE